MFLLTEVVQVVLVIYKGRSIIKIFMRFNTLENSSFFVFLSNNKDKEKEKKIKPPAPPKPSKPPDPFIPARRPGQ